MEPPAVALVKADPKLAEIIVSRQIGKQDAIIHNKELLVLLELSLTHTVCHKMWCGAQYLLSFVEKAQVAKFSNHKFLLLLL